MLNKYHQFRRVAHDGWARLVARDAIPITYFNGTKNVGDLVNPYMIPKIADQPVYRVQSTAFSHLRAVGSMIGSASHNSYIWGAGSIDGHAPQKSLDPTKIRAVRGKQTAELLRKVGYDVDVPLGDPALLMPRLYFPEFTRKKYEIGLIPHFSDRRIVDVEGWVVPENMKIIDVRSDPENFVDNLLQCQIVLSSSLHGLIFSDAYSIPNYWIKFRNKLLGDSYKFLDYYSTTDCADPGFRTVQSAHDLSELALSAHALASVHRYTQSLDDLYYAFPQEFKKPHPSEKR